MRLKELIVSSGMWFFWFPLRTALKRLPLWMTYAITTFLARLISIFYRELQDNIKEQLLYIFPDKNNTQELDRLSKETIVHDLKRRAEELLLGTLSKETISRIISFEGMENLNACIEYGKGTIILLSHFGSFFMILPALARRDYKVNQMVGPSPYNKGVQKMILRARQKENAKLPVNFILVEKGIRPVFQALKNNELVAIALDGRAGDIWVECSFFGRAAYFSQGIMKLAVKTGAAVLPTFIIRQKDNTHRLVFEKPIFTDGLSQEAAALNEHTQTLVSILEGYVAKHPEHFAMNMAIYAEQLRKGVCNKPLFKPDTGGQM
ncbi:MAG: lysophospholipid acyltransferase family protein [Candidatus Magnetominusculus sp. LBB02]|nr:lysophospholipid acyltransferase family protein [Candidatus Magnetominusculus sp. LBB02]